MPQNIDTSKDKYCGMGTDK